MKRLLLAALITCAPFILLPQPSHAQSNYSISSFVSNITINNSGDVHVQEKIQTDFSVEKHGIYRDIPYVYSSGDEKYYTNIEVGDITRDGKSEEKKIEKDGNNVHVRIGDPDVTITGEHIYNIDYTATGVLQGFSTYDELYWNVTGNYWDTSIASATAKVAFPSGSLLDANCWIGVQGAQETCIVQRQSENVYSFTSTRPLQPYEGMTIVVSFPKGSVPLTTVKQPLSITQQFASKEFLFSSLATLILGIGIILWNWARRGRDFIIAGKYLFDPNARRILRPIGHNDTIVVEYTPPEKLKPAEMGVLVDERADTLDVTSSIVDLAVKGFLTIKEVPKKWIFGKVDYELARTKKKATNLDTYEKELLTGIFSSGDKVKISDLKNSFYTKLKEVKKQLYADLIKKGHFPTNPENVRNIYLAMFIVVLIVSFALFIFNQTQFYPSSILTGIAIGLFPTGVIGLIFSRSMSRRTAKGAEMYRRLRGYRLFLNSVEKHKQKFLEDKNLFNQILPYAIVFGLTDKIAKSAEDMGIKPESPTWYSGAQAFHAATFANHVSTFSTSVSNSISSAPKSSGFSSGGGFSGGGFGGGGGGSW